MEDNIVVLANSVKHGAHCVAGKSLSTGRWIRPVSNQQGGELQDNQCVVENPYGYFSVKPLQQVWVGFDAHVPLANQPENYLIDGTVWRQNYRFDPAELMRLIDQPESLWGEGRSVLMSSIRSGSINIEQSLFLVKVEGLMLGYNDVGKRRAKFYYNGLYYDLPVTDPDFDEMLRAQPRLQDILCVSLGEPFDGECYKIVATIF